MAINALRLMLAGVLALAGIKLVGMPEADVGAAGVLCAGLVLAPAFVGRHRWSHVRRRRNVRVQSADE